MTLPRRSTNRLLTALDALPRSNTPDGVVEQPRPSAPAMPAKARLQPEAELCDRIGDWLREDGTEVFFEVPVRSWQPDVVGFAPDGQTIAIETKLDDWRGVLKQGVRNASFFDRSWVAMPFRTANRAAAALADVAADRRQQGQIVRLPGVLGLHNDKVVILAQPVGGPSRRMDPVKLRKAAERYGKERGGVASINQLERNLALWADRQTGLSYAKLAAQYRLSASGVRDTLKRLANQRDHLRRCDGNPCQARGRWKAFYAAAHRETASFLALVGHI